MARDVLYKYSLLTHGLSATKPSTIRPIVFAIPTIDKRYLASSFGIPVRAKINPMLQGTSQIHFGNLDFADFFNSIKIF